MLAADQAVKHALLSGAFSGLDGKTLIPGLLDMKFTWNRGISFSLLWQGGERGSLLLTLGMTVLVAGLLVWLMRADRRSLALAIGLVAGGALGNLIDRYLYHAVFDFLVVRLGHALLFVCNIADIFISLGVVGLLLDAVWGESQTGAAS